MNELSNYEKCGKLIQQYNIPYNNDRFALLRPALFIFRTYPIEIAPKYNDQFILITTDPAVSYTCAGASHSYQFTSKDSPDADGDHLGDTAVVKPGRYELSPIANQIYPVWFLNGGKAVPAFRYLTKTKTLQDNNYTADQILLHCGYDAPPDSPHKSSIGCLTTNLTNLNKIKELTKNGAFDVVLC